MFTRLFTNTVLSTIVASKCMHMHLCTHITTSLTIEVNEIITDRFTHDVSLIMHNSLWCLVTGVENQLERSTWDRNPDVTQGKRQQHAVVSEEPLRVFLILKMNNEVPYEPVHEKINNLCFPPGLTQTGLYTVTEAG